MSNNNQMDYDKASEIIGKTLGELSNDDKLRLVASVIQVVSELEESEYFCIDKDGEVKAIFLSGESAVYMAKCIDEGLFEHKNVLDRIKEVKELLGGCE